MNSDLLLTILAASILSLFILSSGRIINENKRTTAESEFVVSGISLAQSLIDEIKTKSFDNNTTGDSSISSPSLLTSVGLLGPEAGENVQNPDVISSSNGTFQSSTNFDDIDDYKGYIRQVSTPRLGQYMIKVTQMAYADTTNPSTNPLPGFQTFCKIVSVSVYNHPYIDSTRTILTLQYVFTY